MTQENGFREFKFEIAGLKYCDMVDFLKKEQCLPFANGQRLILKPEPTNAYDKYAVAIYDYTASYKLGYVPQDISKEVFEFLRPTGYIYNLAVIEDSSIIESSEPESSYFIISASLSFIKQ